MRIISVSLLMLYMMDHKTNMTSS